MSQSQTKFFPGKTQQSLRTIDEELDHQIKKSKLLDDDRKSFFLNAEETKRKDNEIIDQLKKENKDLKKLRDDMIANKRAATPGFAQTQGSFLSWNGEIKDDKYWIRKHDEALHKTKQKKTVLLNLKDKLNEVTENRFGGQEESGFMRNIRILENRLDKVMIKFNEAQSIRKTYEQIVKRLKEERVGYDNQLAAIERSLKGKEHDFEELLLLAHDATHAKELAQAELKKYEHKKQAVKELRKNYLEDKEKAIKSREEVLTRMEKRDKDKSEKVADKSLQQNIPLELNANLNESQTNIDSNINKQKLADYEEAFRKLNEATGVTDVNEIIQKFITQDETSKSLNDLKQEYIEKIEYLNNEKQRLKDELNDLKYEGGETLTRKQIDEIENNVNNALNKCERTRLKYDRVSKILVNAKAGIEHLVEKLEFYKINSKPNIVVNDDTLVEALAQSVEKMKNIYQIALSDRNYDAEKLKQLGRGTSADFHNYNLNLLDKNSKIEAIKNIRVRPMDKDDDDVSDGDNEDDIYMEITSKVKQKIEMQSKAEKNAKLKGKKRENNMSSNASTRNKSAKCKI